MTLSLTCNSSIWYRRQPWQTAKEKSNHVKRSTGSIIYCRTWWAYGINCMPGCAAIASFSHSVFARGARNAIRPLWSRMQDSEIHRISRRDTGVVCNPITISDVCAPISLGLCSTCNRRMLWQLSRSAICNRREMSQIGPNSHHRLDSPKITRRITSKHRTNGSIEC